MKNKPKIIAITGLTATGKSSLALNLANEFTTEIISADSRLVYNDFKIGVAKPSSFELSQVKHYLIDVTSPLDTYNVGLYVDEAKVAINNILKQGKFPLIVGGTGLYLKALLQDLDLPKSEPDIELREFLNSKDCDFLYKMLQDLDLEFSEKCYKNDKVKIIRSIELLKTFNVPMKEIRKLKEEEYDVLWFGLKANNRDFVYKRIHQRIDEMLEQGLEDELRFLLEKYGRPQSLVNTVGYKELLLYFDKQLSFLDAVNLLKQNTRNYAKRQETWFRKNHLIKWFNIDEMSFDDIFLEMKEDSINFLTKKD